MFDSISLDKIQSNFYDFGGMEVSALRKLYIFFALQLMNWNQRT